MYIKYKSLTNDKISIINVDISNCEIITTNGNKLIMAMPKSFKKENVSLTFNSEQDSIKSLEKLFNTLYNKSPLGNILDLTDLEEQVKIDNQEQGGE
jgi:hypothetical protein